MMEKEFIFKCHVCFRVRILRKCLFSQLTLLPLAFRSYPIWPVHGRMPCASLGSSLGRSSGSWVVVFRDGGSNIFHVHPCLGKWSNLTHIFQVGCKAPTRIFFWCSALFWGRFPFWLIIFNWVETNHLASHGDFLLVDVFTCFFLRHRDKLFVRTFPATWDGDAKKGCWKEFGWLTIYTSAHDIGISSIPVSNGKSLSDRTHA